MGIFKLAKSIGKGIKKGIKKGVSKLGGTGKKITKFYRDSGLKTAISYAPIIGGAIGAKVGGLKGSKAGMQIGSSVKSLLSGNFKQAINAVENQLPVQAKESIAKLEEKIVEGKDLYKKGKEKYDMVTDSAQDFKNLTSGSSTNLGQSLATVEKYLSPEQTQKLNEAIANGKDAHQLLKDFKRNSGSIVDPFIQQSVQTSDPINGSAILQNGIVALQEKGKAMLEEGKAQIADKMKIERDLLKASLETPVLTDLSTPVNSMSTEAQHDLIQAPNLEGGERIKSLKELNDLINLEQISDIIDGDEIMSTFNLN